MKNKFSVKLTKDPQEVVAQFKSAAQKNGFELVGGVRLGHFSGKGIEGRYSISGEDLTIVIEKKPIFISWSMIETKMREFFETG